LIVAHFEEDDVGILALEDDLTAVRRDVEVANMKVRRDIGQLPFDSCRQIDQPEVFVLDLPTHHERATFGQEANPPRATRALQLAFRTNDIPVKAVWRLSGGQGEVSHQFSGFWEIAEQAFIVRIHSGIHYRFDQEAGQKIGVSAAEYVFANFMQRRDHRFD
jgi:hypothetical protein